MFLKIRNSLILILVGFIHLAFSQDLKINEILSSNTSGITDSDGDYSDWIEIHNTTNSTIDLGGYYLSDKIDYPLKWQFPPTSIAPLGYVLVFASEKASSDTELHANFKLNVDGEYVLLSDPFGTLIDQLDSIPLRDNISYGYKIDADSLYKYFSEPTPGAENTTDAYLGFVDDPLLSLPSGFYPNPIDVVASIDDINAEMRYSLNGSEPTSSSPLYSDTLHFQNNASDPNVISMIPTNPGFD